MATGGLYGSTSTGTVAPQSGSESVGLYGNNTVFGGTYFEWFIFQQASTQPATPTGGSWNFATNVGTAPAGWTSSPPVTPTNLVWVSIGVVNSKSTAAITWSAPGLFVFASGTVTNVSALTLGTAGTDVSSTVANPTTTPVITLNLPTASATNRGLLSPADWTAFNAKQPSGTYVNSVSGTTGRITSTGGTTPVIDLASGIVTAGTTGSSSLIPVVTVDTYGRVTGITTASNPQGTVTSVAATVPSFLSISGSPITSSGTLAIGYSGTALPIANGGTGATTAAGALTSLGAIGSIASADGSVTVAQVGSAVDLSVVTAGSTNNVLVQVRNTTGATLTKGTVVYMTGATGQIPTVSKALATSDATSAQTLGMMSADLANNSNGYVTIIGLISNIDTSAFTDGAQLYLSGTTAGTYTSTKTYAPIHLVYVGVVEYAHPTQGKIFVKVQNGYELDEIHNVSARTPTTGQTIVWNGANNLWEQNTVSLSVGVNGILPVANGGTGGTAFTGYLYGNGTGAMTAATTIPTTALSGTITNAQLANSSITINGSAISLGGTVSVGTVTSVTGTSPIVSSGGATPAISLATAYGDTLNPYASKTANYVLAAPNGVAGVPTFRAIVAADIPTLNQNTTGTAANITATSNSTLTTLSSLSLPGSQVSGNISGNAANVTGTVAIANGGTGQTTAGAAFNALSPITTAGDLIIGNGVNSATRLPIGTNGQVLTSNGTTASWAAATGGVTQIIAGTNVSISPAGGTGAVTINATGGGGSSSYSRTTFTATAGQTVFSVTYAVGYLQVYVNGVLLTGSEYTATSGTSFTLAVACSVGDIVEAVVITTGITGVTTGKSIAMALIFGY